MLFGKDSKLAHLLLAVLLRCNALAPHESTDPRSSRAWIAAVARRKQCPKPGIQRII
jgi:hypothetical protein